MESNSNAIDLTTVNSFRAIDARENSQDSAKNDILKTETAKHLIHRGYAVDSLCVFIDIRHCSDVSPLLDGYVLNVQYSYDMFGNIVLEDGEYKNKEARTYNGKGYECRFRIIDQTRMQGSKEVSSKRFIRCAISSKLLEGRYMEGLSYATLDYLLQRIAETGLFKVSKRGLLDAMCTDIDIKTDILMPREKVIERMKEYNERGYKEANGQLTLKKHHGLYTNVGMQFGERGKEKQGAFIKWYCKSLELATQSLEFNEAHVRLNHDEADWILRCELNIKDKKQALKYGVLDAPQQVLTVGKMFDLVSDAKRMDAIFAQVVSEKLMPKQQEQERKETKATIKRMPINLAHKLFIQACQMFGFGLNYNQVYQVCAVMLPSADTKDGKTMHKTLERILDDAKEYITKRLQQVVYDGDYEMPSSDGEEFSFM